MPFFVAKIKSKFYNKIIIIFKMKIKNQGFTLIELLVVIAIIGILATTVMTSVQRARLKARDARRMSDMKQLFNAQQMYIDDHSGLYFAKNGMPSGSELTGYLELIPKDPLNNDAYNFLDNNTVPANRKRFCYWAVLEDGGIFTASQDGTARQATPFTYSDPPTANDFTACGIEN